MASCFATMLREQGPGAFLVSLPLTLLMNAPYAVIMGTTNEWIRQQLGTPGRPPDVLTFMAAGAGAGAVAAACTTPLDAIKTRLQTQHLSLAAGSAAAGIKGGDMTRALAYSSVHEAAVTLLQEGGVLAFFRGCGARMLYHAPSVTICWATYETAKRKLESSGRYR
mmetsp:Transcript_65978/g.175684  ORF Transcript_65978/g.175684 Transcript_65978/m.175684 type:complete len:166 (-) Transcript_65978:317-814(-)